jgi:hypothetical protein
MLPTLTVVVASRKDILVLRNNNFTFDGNHYLQINGTAMGTKMAPLQVVGTIFDV